MHEYTRTYTRVYVPIPLPEFIPLYYYSRFFRIFTKLLNFFSTGGSFSREKNKTNAAFE